MSEILKKCLVCGNDFVTKNKKAIYCSQKCRTKHSYENKGKEYTFRCRNCDDEFVTKDLSKVFCCSDCKNKYYIKNPIRHEYSLVCHYCGKSFTRNLSNKPKKNRNHYCSVNCILKNKNKVGIGKKYHCKYCGEEFDQKHRRHFFCSENCKRKYNSINAPKKDVLCSNCGKVLKRIRHLKQDNFFCNKKCEFEFRTNAAKDIRKCEVCGKEIVCRKCDDLRFCSYECQGVWQSNTRVGKNSPTYKFEITDDMRVKKCEFCGTEMYGTPKSFEVNKYCSNACKNKAMKKSLTKPHLAVCNFLDKNGIKFDTEYPMGRYSFDCYIDDTLLAIEIMGTYYHADVRFYDSPKGEIQEKSIGRDSRKNILANKKGINILYLWEYDIFNYEKVCNELIVSFINNNGKLKNYHSMNYYVEEDNLLLKENILIPHFEK